MSSLGFRKKWFRSVESHHVAKAYEAFEVLNLPGVKREKLPQGETCGHMNLPSAHALPAVLPHRKQWHGVSVLPRAGLVLETGLRKLAHAALTKSGSKGAGGPGTNSITPGNRPPPSRLTQKSMNRKGREERGANQPHLSCQPRLRAPHVLCGSL